MTTTLDTYFRGQLTTRRRRIQDALAAGFETGRLSNLLGEVDQALARLDDGSFGICEKCLGAIETERLVADPLLRLCLDDLSEPEQRALENDLEMAARIQRGLLPPPASSWAAGRSPRTSNRRRWSAATTSISSRRPSPEGLRCWSSATWRGRGWRPAS